LEHDVFRKPVPTPHQVRGRHFRHHALARSARLTVGLALPPDPEFGKYFASPMVRTPTLEPRLAIYEATKAGII